MPVDVTRGVEPPSEELTRSVVLLLYCSRHLNLRGEECRICRHVCSFMSCIAQKVFEPRSYLLANSFYIRLLWCVNSVKNSLVAAVTTIVDVDKYTFTLEIARRFWIIFNK